MIDNINIASENMRSLINYLGKYKYNLIFTNKIFKLFLFRNIKFMLYYIDLIVNNNIYIFNIIVWILKHTFLIWLLKIEKNVCRNVRRTFGSIKKIYFIIRRIRFLNIDHLLLDTAKSQV